MKKIALALLALGVLAPILAQSQPWAAVSDGRRNYHLTLGNPDCPKLELAGMNNSDSTDMLGNPTGVAQQIPALNAQLQQQIVQLEAQLKEMKADDPSRPNLEAVLKQLRATVAQMPNAPAAPKPLNLEQTLAKLRQDLSLQVGSGSLPALEKSAEAGRSGISHGVAGVMVRQASRQFGFIAAGSQARAKKRSAFGEFKWTCLIFWLAPRGIGADDGCRKNWWKTRGGDASGCQRSCPAAFAALP